MPVTFSLFSLLLSSFDFFFSILFGNIGYIFNMYHLPIYLIALGLGRVYSVYYTHIHQFDTASAILLASPFV